jgi:uncharacterized membrane protein
MKLQHIQNPIRGFAVLIVAVIAVYIMWMGYRLNETLSGPGWCRTALGAEKSSATDGTIKGLDACVGLLTIQLKSLATNSHILFGVVALCLLTLIVIVIAGGRLSLAASKTGVSANIGKEVDLAVDKVADAAEAKAAEIKAEPAKFTPPPGETL